MLDVKIMMNPDEYGYEQCPNCNGYGSSLKESAGRCTKCDGNGLVKIKKWQHKRRSTGQWEDCINEGLETSAQCGDHRCGDSAFFGHTLKHRQVEVDYGICPFCKQPKSFRDPPEGNCEVCAHCGPSGI